MTNRILIAGAGGQGVMLIGKVLARAALKTWEHITFFPAYGAEVRGGTSNCQIVLSSEEISSPLAEKVDGAILMNQPSLERFLPVLSENGVGVVNISMCNTITDKRLAFINATLLARELGDKRAANFVMLGVLLAGLNVVAPETVELEISHAFSGAQSRAAEFNIRAFRRGLES